MPSVIRMTALCDWVTLQNIDCNKKRFTSFEPLFASRSAASRASIRNFPSKKMFWFSESERLMEKFVSRWLANRILMASLRQLLSVRVAHNSFTIRNLWFIAAQTIGSSSACASLVSGQSKENSAIAAMLATILTSFKMIWPDDHAVWVIRNHSIPGHSLTRNRTNKVDLF